MNAGKPDEVVTAHDVRTAQFTLVKRGGYDTQEVDAFLDHVAETLDTVAEAEYRAPARPPVEPVAPVPVAPAPVAAVAPVVAAEAPLQLHDPDGAAQRLLAAAQRTGDILTAEAKAYSEQMRADADIYASTTRADADQHAARVTTTAETQAATIRDTAAAEARRVAEETRATLVTDIERLETDRDRLMGDTTRIRQSFEADRLRLLDIVDGLRRDIAGTGTDIPPSGGGGTPVGAASSAPVTVVTPSEIDMAGVADTASAQAVDVLEVDEAPAPLPLPGESSHAEPAPARVEAAVTVPSPEPTSEATVDETPDETPVETSSAAGTAISDPEPDADPSPDIAGAGTIFDIESEPTWSDDGPPTQAMPTIDVPASKDTFFDELRSEGDDGLGPLDDDTDAALTAFFESDDDDDEGWRRRFGGRG